MLTPDHFDSQSAELLRSGRPVLAGISGGRDSMALLSLLSGMPGCNLVACHVNHQLRPEAEEEEMFVLRYAASLGIPCVRERVNVRSMAHTRGIAIEEAAREARQASFLKWAAGYPGALVALAHHRNDQQETALLHLCRGASGIHGMFPVSTWANGLTVVRPMLDFSREDITSYLEHRHSTWREDSSNHSAEYTRNALRHEIIPKLNALFQRDTSLPFSRACRLENQIRRPVPAEDPFLRNLMVSRQFPDQAAAAAVRVRRTVLRRVPHCLPYPFRKAKGVNIGGKIPPYFLAVNIAPMLIIHP